jgi:hypothetical protein
MKKAAKVDRIAGGKPFSPSRLHEESTAMLGAILTDYTTPVVAELLQDALSVIEAECSAAANGKGAHGLQRASVTVSWALTASQQTAMVDAEKSRYTARPVHFKALDAYASDEGLRSATVGAVFDGLLPALTKELRHFGPGVHLAVSRGTYRWGVHRYVLKSDLTGECLMLDATLDWSDWNRTPAEVSSKAHPGGPGHGLLTPTQSRPAIHSSPPSHCVLRSAELAACC